MTGYSQYFPAYPPKSIIQDGLIKRMTDALRVAIERARTNGIDDKVILAFIEEESNVLRGK